MGELALEDLRKEFPHPNEGTLVAVNSLDLEIEDGEFIVMVGPSGCGKSTTLNCIAGLERVSDGDVYLNDERITDQKPRDRNMAMVFQDYALYPHMTARENMAFGLKMSSDMSKEERHEKVENVAELMGISDLLEKNPGELSGGQQQRVALGRAIVREPEVFLMDEPLSNLDAKLRTQMRTELQDLHQELDVTTIYVTHDQTEAMTMGDRIVILNDGKLQQVGTPLECYNEPTNKFVAGFIGSPSMNFFDVEHRNGRLQHQSFDYSLSHETESTIRGSADELVIGIRPEDIVINPSSNENTTSVSVDVVEPMGNMTNIIFTIAGEQRTASVEGNRIVDEGTEVDILFPESRIHLFNQVSGEAIKNSSITGDQLIQSEALSD